MRRQSILKPFRKWTWQSLNLLLVFLSALECLSNVSNISTAKKHIFNWHVFFFDISSPILAHETAMFLRRGFSVNKLSNYILNFVLFTPASDFSLFESFHSSSLQILLSLRLAGSKSERKKYIKNKQSLRNERKY